MNEKAPTRKQRLNHDSDKSDSSTKTPPSINPSQRRKILMWIACNWVVHGYYDYPGEAMRYLLQGDKPWK